MSYKLKLQLNGNFSQHCFLQTSAFVLLSDCRCLVQIETETSEARKTSTRSVRRVDNLKDRLDELKKQYLENEINVQKAELEANSAESLADRAEAVSGLQHSRVLDWDQRMNADESWIWFDTSLPPVISEMKSSFGERRTGVHSCVSSRVWRVPEAFLPWIH